MDNQLLYIHTHHITHANTHTHTNGTQIHAYTQKGATKKNALIFCFFILKILNLIEMYISFL